MVVAGGLLLRRHQPKIDISGAIWAGYFAGIAATTTTALLVSDNVRPFLVELTGVWGLAGLWVVTRFAKPAPLPEGRQAARRRRI
jgi:hypothetical protein